MEHSLGLAGGPGGVQDEERVLRVHGLRRAIGIRRAGDVLVPVVAAVLPLDVGARAAHDHHGLNLGRALGGQRRVQRWP